jgi:hypothetical protein
MPSARLGRKDSAPAASPPVWGYPARSGRLEVRRRHASEWERPDALRNSSSLPEGPALGSSADQQAASAPGAGALAQPESVSRSRSYPPVVEKVLIFEQLFIIYKDIDAQPPQSPPRTHHVSGHYPGGDIALKWLVGWPVVFAWYIARSASRRISTAPRCSSARTVTTPMLALMHA